MRLNSSVPGFSGISGLVAGFFGVAVIISVVTGDMSGMAIVAAGVIVGLMAVRAING